MNTDSPYYAAVITDSASPTLMAAIYSAATGEDLPSCRWWARRHRWQRNGLSESVKTGVVTGRIVVCRRCGTGFSVGSSGWQIWNINDGDAA